VRLRDAVLLAALAALLAAGGAVWLGAAGTPPVPVEVPSAANPGPGPQAAPAAPLTAQAQEAGGAAEPGEPLEAAVRGAVTRDTSGWTDGIIEGSVTLATSVVGRIDHVLVVVTESINVLGGVQPQPKPWRAQKALPIGRSTPRFQFTGVPFSDFGYRVEVFAEGCNGSEAHARIDATHPLVPEEELRLSVTPGVSFTVRLQDAQLRTPLPGIDVALIPHGEPLGRAVLPAKTTDSFGAVRFDDVVRGQWHVHVGQALAPILDPVPVQVAPIGAAQFQVIPVPVGQPLVVRVVGPYDYGIQDAEIVATATDTTQFRQHKGKTALNGDCRFPHLPAGSYQIDVTAPGYGRSTRKVAVAAERPPDMLTVRLVPQ
jgi:hypothetical protein